MYVYDCYTIFDCDRSWLPGSILDWIVELLMIVGPDKCTMPRRISRVLDADWNVLCHAYIHGKVVNYL